MLAGLMAFACTTPRPSQASSPNEIGALLERKTFVFIPQTVSPTGGRTRQITSEFFLRVSPDTVTSYLPYFGRSYSAPINPTQGGMDFRTTDFGYQVAKGKKESTLITIEPRNGTDVRQITMQIFPNGNASLQAISNNRQAISYNGHIAAERR